MLEFLYTGRVAHHKLDTASMAEVLGLVRGVASDPATALEPFRLTTMRWMV